MERACPLIGPADNGEPLFDSPPRQHICRWRRRSESQISLLEDMRSWRFIAIGNRERWFSGTTDPLESMRAGRQRGVLFSVQIRRAGLESPKHRSPAKG